MTVVIVKATIECDDCGTRFPIELDEAQRVESVFEACTEAMLGGQGSYYDGVMRCDPCSSAYVEKWVEEHPTHINGVLPGPDGAWLVSTYDDRQWVIPAGQLKPEFDKPLSDYPHELAPTLTEGK